MLVRFVLGSAVAIAVAAIGGYFALRSVAIDEAKRETRTKVLEAGQLVEATLGDGLLTGKPGARESVDNVVLARVLSNSIVRVKIWSEDGVVLYSTTRPKSAAVTHSTRAKDGFCVTAAPRSG